MTNAEWLLMGKQGEGVETEVTWEDQQNINLFGHLNNKFHELEDEIKAKKVAHVIETLKCWIITRIL